MVIQNIDLKGIKFACLCFQISRDWKWIWGRVTRRKSPSDQLFFMARRCGGNTGMTYSRKRGLVIMSLWGPPCSNSYGFSFFLWCRWLLLKVLLLISTLQPLQQEKAVGAFITQFFQPMHALGNFLVISSSLHHCHNYN